MDNKKYMTTLLRSLLFSLVFLIAGNVLANSDSGAQGIPLRLGDYLSIEYIDLITQTRSPIASGNLTNSRQYMKIIFNADKNLIYLSMGNFHESEAIFVTDISFKKIKNTFDNTPAKIKVSSNNEFTLVVKGKSLHYRYINGPTSIVL